MEKLKRIIKKHFNEEVTDIKVLDKGFSVDKKYVINDKYIVREIDPSRNKRFRWIRSYRVSIY